MYIFTSYTSARGVKRRNPHVYDGRTNAMLQDRWPMTYWNPPPRSTFSDNHRCDMILIAYERRGVWRRRSRSGHDGLNVSKALASCLPCMGLVCVVTF